MIVALTGASGHIGSNLIRELLSLGHQPKEIKQPAKKVHSSKSIQGKTPTGPHI